MTCAYVHEVRYERVPAVATYDVDGTSVCTKHLPEAIAWARGKRAGR